MSAQRFAVRLYEVDNAGNYTDTHLEFDLSDFCNTVPSIGDLIVEPGVLSGLNLHKYQNRTVYEVVHRYFLPEVHDDDLTYVVLVVKDRLGQQYETNIVTISSRKPKSRYSGCAGELIASPWIPPRYPYFAPWRGAAGFSIIENLPCPMRRYLPPIARNASNHAGLRGST